MNKLSCKELREKGNGLGIISIWYQKRMGSEDSKSH